MAIDTSIPFRTFEGPLKRVRLDENETLAMLILDLGFPYFREFDPSDAQRRRIFERFYGSEITAKLAVAHARRRFSGGDLSRQSLPRGRYFTVCEIRRAVDGVEARAEDTGVLRSELRAYSNASYSGPVLVFDWQDESDRNFLARLGRLSAKDETWEAYCVVFLRKKGAPSIMDIIFQEREVDPNFDPDRWGGAHCMIRYDSNPFPHMSDAKAVIDMAYTFNLYYRFDVVKFDRVVDLRYPETQEAFVRVFCPRLIDAHPKIGHHAGFLEMLPSLLADDLGGCHATDVIGSYLRAIGAEALIYPSARFNGYVRFERDELKAFKGWNLVDYRNLPPEELPVLSEDLFPPRQSHFRVEVPSISAEFGIGSWKIRGLIEFHEERFNRQFRQYLE